MDTAFKAIILACAIIFSATKIVKAKSYYSAATEFELNNDVLQLKPGDTLWLESGKREYISFRNFKGELNQPITIKCTGEVEIYANNEIYYQQGINIKNCQYLVFDGYHPSSYYGIRITKTKIGSGLDIRDLSTDITLKYLEISHSNFAGISIKDDPDCLGKSWRDSFIMKNIEISNCYIHNTVGEGIYLGSTAFDGTQILCDNSTTPKTLKPHLIDGVNIYSNKIEDTGREAIQLFSTLNGRIYDNSIRNYGIAFEKNHASGLLLGLGTTSEVYNNRIDSGFGHGIYVNGDGNCKVYNNIISNSGFASDSQNVLASGIYVDSRRINNKAFHYTIANNTIVNTKNNGIRLVIHKNQSNISLLNNLVGGYGSGKTVFSEFDQIAIYPIKRIGIDEFGNFYKKSVDSLYLKNDFSLTQKSGAINCGRANFDFAFDQDFLGQQRSKGEIDAGAIEYQSQDHLKNNSIKHCKLIIPESLQAINGMQIEHKPNDTFCLQGGNYSFIVISNFSHPVVFSPIYDDIHVSGKHVGIILKDNKNISLTNNRKHAWFIDNIQGNGIDINHTDTTNLSSIEFKNLGNNAINYNRPDSFNLIKVNNCAFDNIKGNGILIKSTNRNNKQVRIESCNFKNLVRPNIEINSFIEDVVLKKNNFKSTNAIIANNIEHLTISRNYFECTESSLSLTNNFQSHIYSNIFKQAINSEKCNFVRVGNNSSNLINSFTLIANNTAHLTNYGNFIELLNEPNNNEYSIINNLIIDEKNQLKTADLKNLGSNNLVLTNDIASTIPRFKKGEYSISPSSTAHNQGYNLSGFEMLDFYGKKNNDTLDIGAVFLNGTAQTNHLQDTSLIAFSKDPVSIIVFPNPAETTLNFELANAENPRIEILNYCGLLCKEFTPNDITGSIDISQLENGVYFIRLIDGTELKTIMFTKQH
ncbi:MAG: T9SS type A sorting domain-containing protein [Bacteroidia bacterium]